jgi:predicted HicB family RNase H-like nuclease
MAFGRAFFLSSACPPHGTKALGLTDEAHSSVAFCYDPVNPYELLGSVLHQLPLPPIYILIRLLVGLHSQLKTPAAIIKRYHLMIKNKHRKTLESIFRVPTSPSIKFSDIENLVLHLHGEIVEREGSRIILRLAGETWHCHRPHPGKEAKRYQVEDARNFLTGRSNAMNTMNYKGYTARIDFDERDDIFVGRVLGVRDIISFHASSVSELKAELAIAIDDYLEDCETRGMSPDKPASGKVMLRIRPEVHAAATLAAQAAGRSLNQWADEVFEKAAKSTPLS